MRLTTYISASVFIFFSAVVMKKNEAREQSVSLYNTKWMLKRIHTGTTYEAVNSAAFIMFNDEKKSAGGNGSCNAFGSELSVSGHTLAISNIFSTKMFCEGVQSTEDTFLKTLATANRFTINGKMLSLYNDKELLLEFRKD